MANTMTRKSKAHSKNALRKVLERQDGVCIYCGKHIDMGEQRGVSWSLEHVVPRAVYKWVERVMSKDEVNKCFELIDSKDNLAITCCSCNVRRGSLLPSVDSVISNKYMSDDLKSMYINTIAGLQKYMDIYKAVIDISYKRQNCKCARCGSFLPLSQATLRRRNKNKLRTVKNGMLVCPYCNDVLSKGKYGSIRYNGALINK